MQPIFHRWRIQATGQGWLSQRSTHSHRFEFTAMAIPVLDDCCMFTCTDCCTYQPNPKERRRALIKGFKNTENGGLVIWKAMAVTASTQTCLTAKSAVIKRILMLFP
ncbi:hypothetical protein NE237_007224 [Protea cynaroides]|uniref:Uncharacterized protein n=1 Tax=Protea cynaroides TaxID=273540 RepID=A0A9Q0QVW9_9MAGN|nr:hypothetical protein NE237_007224 [Protea cynaroides]